MVERLRAADHRVVAWARSREAWVDADGAPLATGQLATAAQVVGLALPDDTAVAAVAEDILAEQLNHPCAVVDFGTTSPGLTRDLAAELEPRGVRWFDCPVSGGPQGVGELALFFGGSKEQAQPLLPMLGQLGSVHPFGSVGLGQVAKLANQIVVAGNIAALTEAVAVAKQAGIDTGVLIDAIKRGAGGSWVVDHKGSMLINDQWPVQGSASTHSKDLRYAREFNAHNLGLSLVLTDLLSSWFDELTSTHGAAVDHAALGLTRFPTLWTNASGEVS